MRTGFNIGAKWKFICVKETNVSARQPECGEIKPEVIQHVRMQAKRAQANDKHKLSDISVIQK